MGVFEDAQVGVFEDFEVADFDRLEFDEGGELFEMEEEAVDGFFIRGIGEAGVVGEEVVIDAVEEIGEVWVVEDACGTFGDEGAAQLAGGHLDLEVGEVESDTDSDESDQGEEISEMELIVELNPSVRGGDEEQERSGEAGDRQSIRRAGFEFLGRFPPHDFTSPHCHSVVFQKWSGLPYFTQDVSGDFREGEIPRVGADCR